MDSFSFAFAGWLIPDRTGLKQRSEEQSTALIGRAVKVLQANHVLLFIALTEQPICVTKLDVFYVLWLDCVLSGSYSIKFRGYCRSGDWQRIVGG